MVTLLLADHDGQSLSDQTSNAVAAVLQIGGDVHVLVAGEGTRPIADKAAKLDGVSKVLLAEHSSLSQQLAEPMAALLISLSSEYDVLAAPATTNGKNTMPRVAALLDMMQVSEVMEVVSADTFKRPTYAGNAVQTIQVTSAKKILTIRTASFQAVGEGPEAPVESISAADDPGLSSYVSSEQSGGERPELTSAKVIVSGGRALGSEEAFNEMLFPIADKLGAAIGASRAAVDSGYVSSDLQVGQTGKTVAPDLYIAVGISGAIQHLAGMKDSKVIVAINKDEDAPIFQVSDYGLVADLFTALPELESKL